MTATLLTNQPIHHIPKHLLPDWFRPERSRVLTSPSLLLSEPGKSSPTASTTSASTSSVVYWMQREVRTVDNWALCLASYLASTRNLPLHVVYALPPPPPSSSSHNDDGLPPMLQDMPMTARHGDFLLGGLECVYQELSDLNIPLHVLQASSQECVGEDLVQLVTTSLQACVVICDFSPIRHYREWIELQAAPLLQKAKIPLYQVDAHNIVPVWVASTKREPAARTLRPKIRNVLTSYLSQTFPILAKNRVALKESIVLPAFGREAYQAYLQMDESVQPVPDEPYHKKPGTAAGMAQFQTFLQNGLSRYPWVRNNPTQRDGSSNLSPWINHGHISFQRIAMEVKKIEMSNKKLANACDKWLEQGIIRRELTDNYVFYDPNYDNLNGADAWARETLQLHASDRRSRLYTLDELEHGKTYDALWNAAQLQAVQTGGMHNNLRMYWAKKILEWTESPMAALRIAHYLNDKYCLDGQDPNGFVGIGWCIMGIHDRPFPERPLFGKIRFKNDTAIRKRFNVETFASQYKGALEHATNIGGQTILDYSTASVANKGPSGVKKDTVQKTHQAANLSRKRDHTLLAYFPVQKKAHKQHKATS